MNRVGAVWLAAVILGAASQASIAAEHEALNRLSACASEKDNTVRLACYDREMTQVVARPAAAAPVSASQVAASKEHAASAAVGARKSAQENFGVQGSELARKQQEDDKEAARLKSLTATVTAVSRRPRGELMVTLDNGQVWAEKTPQAYFPVKIGDSVAINAGALGSYRMVVSGRSAQVTRLQ